MKKTIMIILGIILLGLVFIAMAGMYKFNYLANQPGYDVDGNKIRATEAMHPSWDTNKDGLNDCEEDGTCDHSVDYSQPKP